MLEHLLPARQFLSQVQAKYKSIESDALREARVSATVNTHALLDFKRAVRECLLNCSTAAKPDLRQNSTLKEKYVSAQIEEMIAECDKVSHDILRDLEDQLSVLKTKNESLQKDLAELQSQKIRQQVLVDVC